MEGVKEIVLFTAGFLIILLSVGGFTDGNLELWKAIAVSSVGIGMMIPALRLGEKEEGDG